MPTIKTLLLAGAVVCALPATASASVVEERPDGTLQVRAASGERNTVSVDPLDGGGVQIRDLTGLTSRTPLCSPGGATFVRCAIGTRVTRVELGGDDDLFGSRVPGPVEVFGGDGRDVVASGRTAGGSEVLFFGGNGQDTLSYADADRPVETSGGRFDGRPGLDRDNAAVDVERAVGSRFDDVLRPLSGPGRSAALAGGLGDDRLDGEDNLVTFEMGPRADGADRITLSTTTSVLDYSQRTAPVTATVGAGGADDGEAGEGDEVLHGADGYVHLFGGAAGDVLRASPTLGRGASLIGGGGNDVLEGGPGDDTLDLGAGTDDAEARGGDDNVVANDGARDVIACSAGADFARIESVDRLSSCENRRVGVLRLSPRSLRAAVDRPVQVELSWRHPVDWRRLRRVDVRLTSAGAPVGDVAIEPRSGRVRTGGAVRVVRRATRLERAGRGVRARLALRLDPSLAGQTLSADVEAVDAGGGRQVERRAATVRVAP